MSEPNEVTNEVNQVIGLAKGIVSANIELVKGLHRVVVASHGVLVKVVKNVLKVKDN